MKKIILALALLPLLGLAQPASTGAAKPAEETAGGMKFEQGSWSEVLAKAKAEKKYIIMDCMTTWCGPCKHMDKNIFPLKESGDFYNANYLAVKVQFDSTANDDERVKSWKKDMKAIEKEYAINAYPTYLIFDPNGQIVHRSVGATMEAKDFVARGKDGMNPEKQYYTELRKYQGGKNDPAFLNKLALMAQSAYDLKTAGKVANEYVATQTDLFTKDNLVFIDKFTDKSTDKGFTLMLENAEKVNAILGANKAESKVFDIILGEEVYSVLNKSLRAKTTVDWNVVATNLNTKYPRYAAEALSKGKMAYYQRTQDWNNFQTEVVAYMDKYGAKASANDLNSYAWTVFENCKDMTCVTQALDWSKRSFKDKENPMFMDTYANILHKLGKTKEAIEVQERAVALTTDAASKQSLQETLDKMKKGEKTWTDK
jgi:thioredoxin-related protein